MPHAVCASYAKVAIYPFAHGTFNHSVVGFHGLVLGVTDVGIVRLARNRGRELVVSFYNMKHVCIPRPLADDYISHLFIFIKSIK